MGGRPITALNLVCWPQSGLPREMLHEILRGGSEKAKEAGALIVGGHSVADEEVKYGMAVTGVIDPRRVIRNVGAQDRRRAHPHQAAGHRRADDGIQARSPCARVLRFRGRDDDAAERARRRSDAAIRGARRHRHHRLRPGRTFLQNGGWKRRHHHCSRNPICRCCRARWSVAAKASFPVAALAIASSTALACKISEEVSDEMAAIAFDPQTSGGLLIAVPRARGDKTGRRAPRRRRCRGLHRRP